MRREEGGILAGGPHRELVHIRLAEEDGAGGVQARDDGRVIDRDKVLEHLRGAGGADAARRDDILQRHRHAEQGAALAGGKPTVGRRGGGQGDLRGDGDKGAHVALDGGDPVEVRPGQFDGGDVAPREALARLSNRQLVQLHARAPVPASVEAGGLVFAQEILNRRPIAVEHLAKPLGEEVLELARGLAEILGEARPVRADDDRIAGDIGGGEIGGEAGVEEVAEQPAAVFVGRADDELAVAGGEAALDEQSEEDAALDHDVLGAAAGVGVEIALDLAEQSFAAHRPAGFWSAA